MKQETFIGWVRAVLILILISIHTNLSAQNISTPQKKNNMILSSIKNDEAVLSDLNAQFIRNFIAMDTIAHNLIIHRDFVCIQSSGEILDRESYMKGWAHGYDNSHYKTFSYKDEVIRIFGNTALVRSKTVYTKDIDGKTITGSSIYTDTYIKENGRWLCVQAQITGIK